MTPASRPTLGNEMGGVRYATSPRHDLRVHVGAYVPTGFENAPVEGMDDPAGERWYVSLGLWIAIGAAAFAVWQVMP